MTNRQMYVGIDEQGHYWIRFHIESDSVSNLVMPFKLAVKSSINSIDRIYRLSTHSCIASIQEGVWCLDVIIEYLGKHSLHAFYNLTSRIERGAEFKHMSWVVELTDTSSMVAVNEPPKGEVVSRLYWF